MQVRAAVAVLLQHCACNLQLCGCQIN
jgi:hypothetical protein